ncbi:VWA domain-containing protein [Candidatus Woesearchaeota archaeon]|nr:VWA domain-containing protein [Candidatus Woesearchaeota archaeon]
MALIPFFEGIQFANQLGWYAFISLLVLAILYLMRPKPLERMIPSLMFFLQEKGFSKKTSFFRNFLASLLFLIQLIALALLAFSLTSPFTSLFGDQAIDNTVIVLDASASMQAGNRFSQAVDMARGKLNGRVYIILAENAPLLALEGGSRDEALKVLSSARPKDTGTNLGDAMLLAGDVLNGKNGKVVVISDFLSNDGPDPIVAKRVLASKSIPVEFKDVGGRASNAGIVDIFLGKFTSKAVVKNYDDAERQVTLGIISSSGTNYIIRNVLPKSVETFDFSTPEGATELRIKENDDFDVDNHAYISSPNGKKIRVLLVTNSDRSSLKTALQASRDIELSIAEPPVINDLNYDLIVVNSVSPGLILPDFYREALKKVRNGTALVITAQENIDSGNTLLPVKLGSQLNNTKVGVSILNGFTTDIDFGTAFRFYNATPNEGSTVIAEAGKSAMLVLKDEGRGRIVYYGIIDDYSDFKASISYPIFWSKLINFLTQTDDLKEYNFRTGRVLTDSSGSTAYLDRSGFYTVGGRKVSASLLNEKESDVGAGNVKLFDEERRMSVQGMVDKKDVSIEQYLIIAGLAVIFLELLYIKWRGDV